MTVDVAWTKVSGRSRQGGLGTGVVVKRGSTEVNSPKYFPTRQTEMIRANSVYHQCGLGLRLNYLVPSYYNSKTHRLVSIYGFYKPPWLVLPSVHSGNTATLWAINVMIVQGSAHSGRQWSVPTTAAL